MSARTVEQILCCPNGCEAERGNSCGAEAVGPEVRSALRAAGYEIVPVTATTAMENACIRASLAFLIAHKLSAIWPWSRNRNHVRGNIQACWRAMLATSKEAP
jgi:hypothetical protein